jgi:hypothetical protein
MITRGMYREMRGTVRNMFGRMIRNRMLGMRGNCERIIGRTQRALGRTCAACGL